MTDVPPPLPADYEPVPVANEEEFDHSHLPPPPNELPPPPRPGIQHHRIRCPYCDERGHVTVKIGSRKRGISGGKATAAVLTAGVSLLATGLSRRVPCRSAYCHLCGMAWTIE